MNSRRPVSFSKDASLWTIVSAALGMAGCVATHSIRVAAGNAAAFDQDPDGTPVLRSHREHAVAVRLLTPSYSTELASFPSFSIIVTNHGPQNLSLSPRNIAAFSGGQKVTILDSTALRNEIARAGASGQRPTLLEGMRDATQSGEPTTYHPENSMPVDRPNPTDPKIEPLNNPSARPPVQLLDEILQSQSIRPGQLGGGRVTLDPRDIASGAPLKIVVNLAGEQHTFVFDVR